MITKYDIVTGFFNMFFSLVRSGIYIGMILAWGVSVKRRILHSTVRGYLLAITVLLLFWMSVRTCKYLLLTGLDGMPVLVLLLYTDDIRSSYGVVRSRMSWQNGRLYTS